MHYVFKLVIAGDGGVGKTTLLHSCFTRNFSENVPITWGVQHRSMQLFIDDNQVDLQICDFGGMDCFRHILPKYCRGAHGAIFLYDITSNDSLRHIDSWVSMLRSQGGEFPIIAGGAKADLIGSRKVPFEEAVTAAKKVNVQGVIEVSAKTGKNVKALFENICVKMIKETRQETAQAYQKLLPRLVNMTI